MGSNCGNTFGLLAKAKKRGKAAPSGLYGMYADPLCTSLESHLLGRYIGRSDDQDGQHRSVLYQKYSRLSA